MNKKLPKILTIFFLAFIIFNSAGFLFINIFYNPALAINADMPDWTMPNLQIPISEKLTALLKEKPQECKDANGQDAYCINWLGYYIREIYSYAIGIVGILAAVVLMVGGVIWLTAGGSAERIGNAKSWIVASLTGLIIALTSFLILATINPKLTQFEPITVAKVKSDQKSSVIDQNYINQSKVIEKLLYESSNKKIFVNKETCQYRGQTDCTSLTGLPQKAITGLLYLASGCNCNYVITGGTEAGHIMHGEDQPVVDIRYKTSDGLANTILEVFLLGELKVQIIPTTLPGQPPKWVENDKMRIIKEGNSDGSIHFHIEFK
ncbi:MAG: hypothetical protein ABH830_04910 [Patescibacteria group bacterium]